MWEVEYLKTEKELANGYRAFKWAEIHKKESTRLTIVEYKDDFKTEEYRYRLAVFGNEAIDWTQNHFVRFGMISTGHNNLYGSNNLEEIVEFTKEIKENLKA